MYAMCASGAQTSRMLSAGSDGMTRYPVTVTLASDAGSNNDTPLHFLTRSLNGATSEAVPLPTTNDAFFDTVINAQRELTRDVALIDAQSTTNTPSQVCDERVL